MTASAADVRAALARRLADRRRDGHRITAQELLERGDVLDEVFELVLHDYREAVERERQEAEADAKAEADAIAAAKTAIAKTSKAIDAVQDEHRITALCALIDTAADLASSANTTRNLEALVPATRGLLTRVGSLVAAVERRCPDASLRAAFIAEVIAPRAR